MPKKKKKGKEGTKSIKIESIRNNDDLTKPSTYNTQAKGKTRFGIPLSDFQDFK